MMSREPVGVTPIGDFGRLATCVVKVHKSVSHDDVNDYVCFPLEPTMSRPSTAVLLVIACTCAASGCAAFATKPPTPADNISPQQAAAITAAQGERFFILLFSSQTCPKHPKYTHSWATVVKVTGCDGPGAPKIEQSTISWLPATLNIRVWSLCVEPGVNLTLDFTIQEMLRTGQRVSMWGPYE